MVCLAGNSFVGVLTLEKSLDRALGLSHSMLVCAGKSTHLGILLLQSLS